MTTDTVEASNRKIDPLAFQAPIFTGNTVFEAVAGNINMGETSFPVKLQNRSAVIRSIDLASFTLDEVIKPVV